MKIKYLSLEALGRIQAAYAGAEGVYNDATDIIYLDSSLPKFPRPSSVSVLQHERGHALLYKAGVRLPKKPEECFCDLYAMASTPATKLTGIEAVAREIIFEGLRWGRHGDRPLMLFIMLEHCSYPVTQELAEHLAEMKL